MKTLGIVKRIDELGRLVIPYEIRRSLDIDKDNVEFFLDGDKLIITKWNAHCLFCGSTEELSEFKDKHVCRACREAIAKEG